MNFKILKKDFKRKKSTNIILLIFVILSSMFISSSIKNMTVILGGLDNFIEKAKLADYIFLTMREKYEEKDDNDRYIEEFLAENRDTYQTCDKDDILYLSKKNVIMPDGDPISNSNTMIINSISIKQQEFFDENNEIIDTLEDGKILMPLSIMKSENLSKGDKIKIKTDNGFVKEYELQGGIKDCFLGSELMGTKRFVISDKDFDALCNKSGLPAGYIYSINSDDVDSFTDAYYKAGFAIVFGGDKSVVKTTYMMNMVVAGVLLIVSVCLILISIAMLRFIIKFSLKENYHEIGIMKAIGLQNKSIRILNIVKYAVIAIIGSLIGFCAGLPFGNVLLKNVTDFMIIEDSSNIIILFQLLTSLVVAAVIILFAYLATNKVKKMTPMDAIRSGSDGENYRKSKRFFLRKSKLRPTTYMAINDVLKDKKKYIALLITSIVGIWLLIMPINTVNTLTSESMSGLFGVQRCDYFISDEVGNTECLVKKDRNAYVEYLDNIKKKLVNAGIPVEKMMIEVMNKYSVSHGDKNFKSLASQGINTKAENYDYCKGDAPMLDNEVAISTVVSKEIDAGIGDTINIIMFNEKKSFVVTGIYESMTNMGEGLRFNENTKIDYSAVSGCFSAQVVLKEGTDPNKVSEYMRITEETLDDITVQDYNEYVTSMIGKSVSDTLVATKILIFVMVLIINVLVVTLMQKMFFIREQGTIGMLKSIGFSNRQIVIWQAKRIALVLLVGMIIGGATATPFSKLTAGQVFKIMGVQSIKFVIKPLEVFVMYPIVIFVITMLFCMLSMLKVRKINVQEMNNVE